MGLIFAKDENEKTPDKRWIESFKKFLPEMRCLEWPINQISPDVKYAVVWKPSKKLWEFLPNLEYVFVLGAGVDSIVWGSNKISKNINVVRIVDGGMSKPMADYVLCACIFFQRALDKYRDNQLRGIWQQIPYNPPRNWRIGVMGVGVIGSKIAEALTRHGFDVSGWARTKKSDRGYEVMVGKKALRKFLSEINILVNVLPLTDETHNILNKRTFSQMRRASFLINIGRGETIVESDLLSAIDSGQIKGAFLDVFEEEPLRTDHPFFSNPSIFITPHVAAPTFFQEAFDQILKNIRLIEAGKQPAGLISRSLGY